MAAVFRVGERRLSHDQRRPTAGWGGPQPAAVSGADGHAKKRSRELTGVNSTASGGSAVAGGLVVLSAREGVVIRRRCGLGLRRVAAGVRVPGLEAAELEVK